MSQYRKVPVRVWTDATFRRLSQSARMVWLYLSTSPATSSFPGLLRCGVGTISDDTRLPPSKVRSALAELAAVDMVRYDADALVVWLPGAMRDNLPENKNVLAAWGKALEAITDCALKDEAVAKTYEYAKSHCAWMSDAPPVAETVCLTVRDTVPDTVRPTVCQPREQRAENREQDPDPSARERAIPDPEPDPAPDPCDVTTAHGLVHAMRVAVEAAHPERGFYNPGLWGSRDAAAFLDGFQGRQIDAREAIESRLRVYASDAANAPWSVGEFVKRYNAIGAEDKNQDARYGYFWAEHKPEDYAGREVDL